VRRIVLTEVEFKKLKDHLNMMLSMDSYLGSKFLRDESQTTVWHLYSVKHKLDESEKMRIKEVSNA